MAPPLHPRPLHPRPLHPQGSYLFFGTASLLHRRFKAHIAHDALRPRCERTKLLIVDMSGVDGMDATAGSIFTKIQRLVRAHSITLVWAGLVSSVEVRAQAGRERHGAQ